jgi:hypothetical protein
MNTLSKILILMLIGIILLAISIVIGEQSGINLTWLVAFILLVLWNVLPKKKEK